MSQKWRIGITAVLVIAALFAFWNTFKLWTMTSAQKQELQVKDPGELLKLQQKAIRLGLDLQGGIHVVLRVKLEELNKAEQEGAVDRAISVVRNRIDGLGVAEPVVLKEGNDRIIVDLPGYTDAARAEELIGQTAVLQFKLLETMDNAKLVLARIDTAVTAFQKETSGTPATPTASKSKPAPKTASADTSKSGDLLADLTSDTSKATSDTAGKYDFDTTSLGTDTEPFSTRLEPILFSQRTNASWPGFNVNKSDKPLLEKWLALPAVRAAIPQDDEFDWSTRAEIRSGREVYQLYLVKRKVQFPGKYLEGISLGRDATGGFAVDFKLSGDGAARFAQLTGANIDKPLAIVLDDKVESAPFINSKIRNRGQITMGGSATFDDANNLAIVLKAGALPAPVEIIERNIVGATLGEDSIRKGFYSSLIGLLLVLAYIAFYYRISGLIADLGLLFNVFFLMAILAALGATLTMPGIAGIILTIGISVDSNILIFERIREELRTGKTVRAAIDAGYNRAWVTIFDSHVTTLITAGALFLLGSGTIKGFAVTLFWGVTLSLYTAYIITKAVFDFRKQYETLSI
jgi:SecD/SecF fusion protein